MSDLSEMLGVEKTTTLGACPKCGEPHPLEMVPEASADPVVRFILERHPRFGMAGGCLGSGEPSRNLPIVK